MAAAVDPLKALDALDATAVDRLPEKAYKEAQLMVPDRLSDMVFETDVDTK